MSATAFEITTAMSGNMGLYTCRAVNKVAITKLIYNLIVGGVNVCVCVYVSGYICVSLCVCTCTVVMCDTYRYIEISICSFNIVIQYWLLSVSIHWNGQFSKHGFSNSSNLIPKSNYKKLVHVTFFYDFLTNTSI